MARRRGCRITSAGLNSRSDVILRSERTLWKSFERMEKRLCTRGQQYDSNRRAVQQWARSGFPTSSYELPVKKKKNDKKNSTVVLAVVVV